MPEYINIKELAAMLRIKPQTVCQYRYRQKEKLPPAINATGHPLWLRSDVEAWLKSHREEF